MSSYHIVSYHIILYYGFFSVLSCSPRVLLFAHRFACPGHSEVGSTDDKGFNGRQEFEQTTKVSTDDESFNMLNSFQQTTGGSRYYKGFNRRQEFQQTTKVSTGDKDCNR